MSSIEKVLIYNNYYNKEKEKLEQLFKKIEKINKQLDLNEVNEKLNHKETKELFELIKYRCNKSPMLTELKEIIYKKKIQEYPQILDVHYYPIINNIDFLTKEEKIELNKSLKIRYYQVNSAFISNNSKIIDFLIDNRIIEKQYIFHCNCGSDECYNDVRKAHSFRCGMDSTTA